MPMEITTIQVKGKKQNKTLPAASSLLCALPHPFSFRLPRGNHCAMYVFLK